MENLEILTIRELASLLRVSERSIYRKAVNKEIPGSFRVGINGSFRFVKGQILDWINNQAHYDKIV